MGPKLPRPAEGWLTLILLGVVLFFPVATVVSADWVDNLHVLYWLMLGGLLAGFVFARIPAPAALLNTFSLPIGIAAAFYVVASTLPHAPEGPRAMLVLWKRLAMWLAVVQEGGFGNEPVLFLLLLAEATWLAAYLGAWFVYRERSGWWALLTGGAALIVNVSYAPELLPYVPPFAIACLLLVSRLNLYRRELAWRAAGLQYSPSIWGSTLRAGLVVSLLIAGFGWYAPEIPPRQDVDDLVRDVSQPWHNLQNEFNRLFGGIRGRGVAAPSLLSGFGKSLALGGRFRLASHPVLRVTSPEERYWRAVVYDRYTGHGWTIGQPTTSTRVEPGTRIVAHEDEQREELSQIVEVLQPRGDFLVGSSAFVEVDLPVSVEAYVRPLRQQEGNEGQPLDVVALRASLSAGKRYVVVSSVSRASADMLRQAGRSYPRDVANRFARLPEIPRRVRDLSLQLTQPYDNPYDKARAVERYLRSLAYSLDVAPPPPERDGVDYFLFDAKEGYCDYFASAMAVMLRSIGIPARVVSGYATGSREGGEHQFVVRDNNAHSWVEVYFPRYGWIEFDPTPSQPLIEHPVGTVQVVPTPTPAEPDAPGGEEGFLDDLLEPPRDPVVGFPFAGADELEGLRTFAAILVVVTLGALVLFALWNAGLSGLPPAAAAYARVAQLASVLGWHPHPAETPTEYTRRLSQLAPGQDNSFDLISDSYVAFRFGHRATTPGEGSILASAWLNARRGLLRAAAARLKRGLAPRWIAEVLGRRRERGGQR